MGVLYILSLPNSEILFFFRNLKELPDIYDRRLAACGKLESAETALMKTAAKLRLGAIKKAEKSGKKGRTANDDIENVRSEDYSIVPKEERPTHKLGSIPFFGQKVDTIEWAREEIRVCTELLEKGRAIIERDGQGVRKENRGSEETEEDFETPDANKDNTKDVNKSYPPLNSAFVTFNRQIAAHLAMQVLAHHEPYRMSM